MKIIKQTSTELVLQHKPGIGNFIQLILGLLCISGPQIMTAYIRLFGADVNSLYDRASSIHWIFGLVLEFFTNPMAPFFGLIFLLPFLFTVSTHTVVFNKRTGYLTEDLKGPLGFGNRSRRYRLTQIDITPYKDPGDGDGDRRTYGLILKIRPRLSSHQSKPEQVIDLFKLAQYHRREVDELCAVICDFLDRELPSRYEIDDWC
jgi:hypothetical protein